MQLGSSLYLCWQLGVCSAAGCLQV
ncbi:hypothetical protein LSH36_415g01020, partial [Paralvinella palmiformis]